MREDVTAATEQQIRNMEDALHDLRGRIAHYKDVLERAYESERRLVNEIADARGMP